MALAAQRDGALGMTLREHGARVAWLEPGDGFGAEEERVGEWARGAAPLDAFVFDARGSFGSGGATGVSAASELAWLLTREVAVGAMIESGRGGSVTLIGPPPHAGELAQAARAALENLARTLSVEWARFSITPVMLAPGANTGEAELAELVCFLCSRAGKYLSGCRLALR